MKIEKTKFGGKKRKKKTQKTEFRVTEKEKKVKLAILFGRFGALQFRIRSRCQAVTFFRCDYPMNTFFIRVCIFKVKNLRTVVQTKFPDCQSNLCIFINYFILAILSLTQILMNE